MKNTLYLLLILILSQFLLGKQISHKDSGFAGLWHFDEKTGAAVHDSSNNSNDLTITDMAWVSGKYNYGLSGTGAGEYCQTATVGGGFNGASEGTFMFWVKLTGSRTHHYFAESDGGLADQAYITDAPPAYIYSSWENISGETICRIPVDLDLNKWYHWTTTYKKGVAVNQYLNGVWIASQPVTNNVVLRDGTAAVTIFNHSNGANYIDGTGDEAAFYTRALSAGEIKTKYDEQKGKFIN